MTRVYHPPQPEQQPWQEQNVDFAPDDEAELYDAPAPGFAQEPYDMPREQGYFPEGFDAYADDVYSDADLPYAPTNEIYMDDRDLLTEEERALERWHRWHMLANLSDFLGVIAGTLVILVLIALLISMLNWLSSDIRQTFTLWQVTL